MESLAILSVRMGHYQGKVVDLIQIFLSLATLRTELMILTLFLSEIDGVPDPRDYKPIALCNVICKVVANILTNRLHSLLDSVVSTIRLFCPRHADPR